MPSPIFFLSQINVSKKKLLIILFLLLDCFIYAQQPDSKASGKISGRIIDSLTGKGVEYATISLLLQEENKVVNGTTTDDKGVFNLNGIRDGKYKMLIYFVGYKTGTKTDIIIDKTNSSISLGNIKLINQQTTLKEVVVEGEKSIIESKIDKIVYNAERDLTSQGGVATDLLKKVPQVSVDVDGNVDIQGNTNIRFLINGKPSSVFGNNLTDVLQSIPASQIQSIEVITSPGARYDAEGTGGIINIILKKVTAQGINGNVALTGGTRLENGSFNLSARKGKFGANTFFSGNGQINTTTINSMNRASQDPTLMQNTQLNQNGTSDFTRRGFQTGASIDWAITPKNNITAAFSYNNFGNNTVGSLDRYTILQDASSGNTLSNIENLVNSSSNFNSQVYDWNLNYKKTFNKEGQELDILYSASNANNYSYYSQQQSYITPDSVFNGSYGKSQGTDRQTNISISYTQPLAKDIIFETGAKTVLRQLNNTSDVFLLNPPSDNYSYSSSQSSSLNYKRNIYAYYISLTFKLFNYLDVKAGCRYEYTQTNASFSNVSAVNIQPYNSFIPSGIISHAFKNHNTFKISYTHRIQRPDYGDLNPFQNVSDPKNITTGNPNLMPEIANNVELGYNKAFEKGANINIALFFRGNLQDIQSYTTYYPTYQVGDSTYTNVAVSKRENIGRENNYGMNIFASVPINKKINIRSNVSGFQRYITNYLVPNSNISGFNYRANLNASFQLLNTLAMELFGNYNSQRITVQGKLPAFLTYNIAIRLQLFHKKGSIALTATNPFNKYVNQKTELTGTDFTLYTLRELPYRSFGINFTYKFGKLEFKKQKEAEDPNLTNPPIQGN
jgi:outer membrane receptor protein involved in Fe transport